MRLSYKPYMLQLRHVFTLATSSRTHTPVVLTSITLDGLTGYGEASLPPYLGATQETVMDFLSQLDLSKFTFLNSIDEIMEYVDGIAPGNTAAKASVDIALHDLFGKYDGLPLWKSWGLDPSKAPATSFTIGIDSRDEIRKKTLEAAEFKLLKVKLGTSDDKDIIRAIRSVTDIPLCVDANQGWTDRYYAQDMLYWLEEQGAVFAEQPMPKEQLDDIAWLTQHSPLPTIADESFQRLDSLNRIKGAFTGVNIKLMKCTGLNEARKIVAAAREADMKVMLGCMTETTCAISAAVQMASSVDFADLDGHLLITNDAFTGLSLKEGVVLPSEESGLGIRPVLF